MLQCPSYRIGLNTIKRKPLTQESEDDAEYPGRHRAVVVGLGEVEDHDELGEAEVQGVANKNAKENARS